MSLQPNKSHPDIRPGDRSVTLVDMVFPATEVQVRWAVCETMEKLRAFEIAPDFQFAVEIVLAELLNNVAEHGYPSKAKGDVRLSVMIIEDGIRIETRDRGVQMPGLRAPHPPEPNLDVDRDDLPEGQFGWFMIRELCQDLTYQRIENENCMSLLVVR